MPAAETLIHAAYIICAVTLVSVAAYVLLDLRRWARRAKDADKS